MANHLNTTIPTITWTKNYFQYFDHGTLSDARAFSISHNDSTASFPHLLGHLQLPHQASCTWLEPSWHHLNYLVPWPSRPNHSATPHIYNRRLKPFCIICQLIIEFLYAISPAAKKIIIIHDHQCRLFIQLISKESPSLLTISMNKRLRKPFRYKSWNTKGDLTFLRMI